MFYTLAQTPYYLPGKILTFTNLSRADKLLNKPDTGGGTAATLLAPPEIPLHVLRRTSEGSLPWGTSISVESGSDDEDYDEEMKDSTPAEEKEAHTGNGIGTDGASDGAGERRGSNVKDLLEKRKKGEKRRRKPDKQGTI